MILFCRQKIKKVTVYFLSMEFFVRLSKIPGGLLILLANERI